MTSASGGASSAGAAAVASAVIFLRCMYAGDSRRYNFFPPLLFGSLYLVVVGQVAKLGGAVVHYHGVRAS